MHQAALLTNHGYGVCSDDVLRQLDIGRVAYHHDAAAGAIYVESYVRGSDPAALRRWLGPGGVTFEIMTVHRPFDIRRWVRVLRGACDHHLLVRLRLRWPADRHSGWRDCERQLYSSTCYQVEVVSLAGICSLLRTIEFT